ncbi:hypothetical protein CPB97_012190, partial [Podila verticillata]
MEQPLSVYSEAQNKLVGLFKEYKESLYCSKCHTKGKINLTSKGKASKSIRFRCENKATAPPTMEAGVQVNIKAATTTRCLKHYGATIMEKWLQNVIKATTDEDRDIATGAKSANDAIALALGDPGVGAIAQGDPG